MCQGSKIHLMGFLRLFDGRRLELRPVRRLACLYVLQFVVKSCGGSSQSILKNLKKKVFGCIFAGFVKDLKKIIKPVEGNIRPCERKKEYGPGSIWSCEREYSAL